MFLQQSFVGAKKETSFLAPTRSELRNRNRDRDRNRKNPARRSILVSTKTVVWVMNRNFNRFFFSGSSDAAKLVLDESIDAAPILV